MLTRFTKRSIVGCAMLAAGLILGVALAPVAAQVSPLDGQVAIRSDGSLYLITNGQRRWVSTVVITDDEINAYPEGEPIYTGLAPLDQTGSTASVAPRSSPVANTTGAGTSSTGPLPSTGMLPSVTGSPAASSGTTSTGTTANTGPTVPNGATGEMDPSIPIEVDIDGTTKFEPGETIVLDVKTRPGLTCDLAVKWPDGTEVDQPRTVAESNGHCHYAIDVPATATTGTGTLKGFVRDGSRMSRQNVEFEIIPATAS